MARVDVAVPPVVIGQPVETFAGAGGEANARTFDVHGFAFLARRP